MQKITSMQATGIIKIANVLQTISSLTQLFINSNNITTEAADAFVGTLSHNSKLQVLSLGDNDLQTTGIVKVAKGLQKVLPH